MLTPVSNSDSMSSLSLAASTTCWQDCIKKYIKLFSAVFLFVFCWMAVYGVVVYQPKYASKSLVMIKDSAITNRYVIPDQNYALQTTSSSSANPVLNTMGLLKAKSVSDALWQYLRKDHYEDMKKRGIKTKKDWENFYGNGKAFIKSKNEPGTDLISIQFVWNNPTIAKNGLEVILNAFREASLNLNRSEQINRSKYLTEQVEMLENRLQEIRKKKSQYKSGMKIASLSRKSEELASTGIELENKLAQVEANAQGKEAEYARYQRMLNMSSEQALEASALGMKSTLSKLQDQLYTLSQSHALLKTTLTDKNPKVQEVRAQINQIENDIKKELTRTLGKAEGDKGSVAVADSTRGTIISQMVSAQTESVRLSTEAEVIRSRIAEVNRQIEILPNMEEELNAIEDEERTLSSSLSSLRQKEMEARMKQAETLSNVFVVDPPGLPGNAGFPSQLHIMIFGLLASLSAATLAVFAKINKLDLKLKNLMEGFIIEDRYSVSLASIKQKLSENFDDNIKVSAEYENAEEFLADIFRENESLYGKEKSRLLKQRLYQGLLSAREFKNQATRLSSHGSSFAAYAK